MFDLVHGEHPNNSVLGVSCGVSLLPGMKLFKSAFDSVKAPSWEQKVDVSWIIPEKVASFRLHISSVQASLGNIKTSSRLQSILYIPREKRNVQ